MNERLEQDKSWKKAGYVRLYRAFRDDPLWRKRRKFSQWEAWIDMYLEARGVDTPKDKPFIFQRHIIPLKRGQFVTSQSTLAKRWGWSTGSVQNFLRKLIRRKTISVTGIRGGGYSVITILNYSDLNPLTDSDLMNPQQGTTP